MDIEIHYTLGEDLTALYGIEGEGTVAYKSFWDAPVSNPQDPRLWEVQKKDLLNTLEGCIQRGEIPFVTIFVPEKH